MIFASSPRPGWSYVDPNVVTIASVQKCRYFTECFWFTVITFRRYISVQNLLFATQVYVDFVYIIFNAHTRSQNFKLPNCFVITELKTMFRTKCVSMSIVYLHIKRHNLDVINKYIIRLDGAFIFLNYTKFNSQIKKSCMSP
jgi:hypothetical protein